MSIITENPGVIYIASKGLNRTQIVSVVERILDRASKILNRPVSRDYELNPVTIGDNHLYTYVFIKDRGVVNIMQNLKEDGTKRVERKIKKDCKYVKRSRKDNEKEKKKRLKTLYNKYFGRYYDEDNKNWVKDTKYFGGKQVSWADFQEEEDEINNDYEPQYEVVTLPPCWTEFNDSVFKHVNVFPSEPKALEADKKCHILEGIYVVGKQGVDMPAWVTEQMLRDIFRPYDTKNNYKLIVKDNELEREYYPLISFPRINNGGKEVRACRIEFDPQSNDARYVIHMKRRAILKKGRDSIMVYFNFPSV